MKNRVSVALNRGRMIHGKRVPAGTVPGGDAPIVTAFSMSGVTETSITMTWTCDQYVTGQLRYGTTPTQLNQTTLKEVTFDWATHIQTISGLTAATDYYIQAFGENAAGDGYASGVVLIRTQGAVVIPPGEDPPTYDPITYTSSVTLPGFYGGYTIDHTGNNDSTPGVQAWIKANAGGTDTTHHKRLIFPPTSIIKINTAICLGGANMSFTTLWGHAATSSAWIRGDAASYLDVGCQIKPDLSSWSPHHSAFIYGSVYSDFQSISFNAGGEGFIVRGFDIRGPSPTPGTFGGYENQNALEYGTCAGSQFAYNKVQGVTGDLVRFRSGRTGRVHHNYALNCGRMGITAVTNYGTSILTRSDNVAEYNTIDRCGYWGIDIEPEDESTSSLRKYDGIVIRNNRFGSFGEGGFMVIGGTAVPDPNRHLADMEISGNIIDGYGYGSYSLNKRDMWMLIAHTATLSSVPVGSDPRPQNIIIRNNVVTHGAAYAGAYPEVLRARYTDGLVVTGNDANYGGSDWMTTVGCTSITESGNT